MPFELPVICATEFVRIGPQGRLDLKSEDRWRITDRMVVVTFGRVGCEAPRIVMFDKLRSSDTYPHTS